MPISRKKALVFLALTFTFSAVFYFFMAASKSVQYYVWGLMWCPGGAAILIQLFFHRSWRGLGWKPGPIQYVWLGYGLPIGYCLVLYGVVWFTGLGRFAPDGVAAMAAVQLNIKLNSPLIAVALYALTAATLGMLSSGVTALGEEIGWRGLLVPELAKETSFTKTALLSGGIWAVWHYPGILLAGYRNASTPLWFNLFFFTVAVIGTSFALAWLRLRSNSLWPAVLFHASHNLFIQGLFTPLTADTGLTSYVIGEFGIGLALVALLVAWLFWRRRGELPVAE